VTFSHDGIVTIGCNIHDEMLAYIVVVDTELYAMTDSQGVVTFDISNQASEYKINIWSPRIRDDEASLVRRVLPENSASVEFALVKALWPSRNDETESIEWSDY
jgi:TPP-dependent indolepyruvate ferredoxin oxidoreductase alpha subunit